MGGYNCYCAFCGAVMDNSLRIGSTDKRAGYDPEIVSEEAGDATRWLGECRGVGHNPDAPGISKAFITPRGSNSSYMFFEVEDGSTEPNDPSPPGEDYACYVSGADDVEIYPFHEACRVVFCRSLFGHHDVTKIDSDTFYNALENIHGAGSFSQLFGDYGIRGNEQYWICLPGEEYAVFNPSVRYDMIVPTLLDHARRTFGRLPSNLALGHKVKQDPFSALPHDVLFMLSGFLEVEDIFALIRSSWHVFQSTCANVFWKRMIRQHIQPWFWEMQTLLDSEILQSITDAKGFYFWLDKITRPDPATNNPPFLGIINRRRVWGMCEKVKQVYLRPEVIKAVEEVPDLEAQEIMENCTSSEMPKVFQQQTNGQTHSKQLIYAWKELHSIESIFQTFWDKRGRLVGLGTTIDSIRRVLGQAELSLTMGGTCHSVTLPDGEWIRGLIFHIDDSIKSISIMLTSGTILGAGPLIPKLDHRFIAVAPGTHLVGITARVVDVDDQRITSPVIARLGLLQCDFTAVSARVDEDIVDQQKQRTAAQEAEQASHRDGEPPLAQRLLWKGSFSIEQSSPAAIGPMCLDRRFNLLPFSCLDMDNTAHEVLLWGKEQSELQQLIRVSVCVGQVRIYHLYPDRKESSWRMGEHMIGMQVDFEPSSGKPSRTIGFHKPDRLEQGATEDPDELKKHFECFDVNGPGGETITSLEVSQDVMGVKIHTSSGREHTWGEGRMWYKVQPATGDILVGVVAGFYPNASRLRSITGLRYRAIEGQKAE